MPFHTGDAAKPSKQCVGIDQRRNLLK